MVSCKSLINTGNILSLNDKIKIASQNSSDELIQVLKFLQEQSKGNNTLISQGLETISLDNVERKDVTVTVKVFISSSKAESLKQALDQVFNVLNTEKIESLVIALSTNENEDNLLSSLKSLWIVVEEYVKLEKLSNVGISDVSTEIFLDLFNWANVKPNIVQINLTTCCVVPPALQEFTKENDVQLLTHSDPCRILPPEALEEIFGSGMDSHWVVRYQVHLKCRGILSSKGYLIYLNETNNTT